eukprot:3374865-Rhodomonas_salina.3
MSRMKSTSVVLRRKRNGAIEQHHHRGQDSETPTPRQRRSKHDDPLLQHPSSASAPVPSLPLSLPPVLHELRQPAHPPSPRRSAAPTVSWQPQGPTPRPETRARLSTPPSATLPSSTQRLTLLLHGGTDGG